MIWLIEAINVDILGEMPVSDKLQLIAILVTSVTAVISIIISILTLRQTNKITREANRAYINVYLDAVSIAGTNSVYFIIKNHGNTAGRIIDFKCSLPDIKKAFILDPFENLINYELAPKQSFSTFLKTDGIDIFTCEVRYLQGKKVYDESFTLNPKFAEGIVHIEYGSNPPKEVSDVLRNITEAYIKSRF